MAASILRLGYERVRHAERIGHFDPRHYQDIIDRAAEVGIEITPYDFIAHLVPRPLRAIQSDG